VKGKGEPNPPLEFNTLKFFALTLGMSFDTQPLALPLDSLVRVSRRVKMGENAESRLGEGETVGR